VRVCVRVPVFLCLCLRLYSNVPECRYLGLEMLADVSFRNKINVITWHPLGYRNCVTKFQHPFTVLSQPR
jgi:hypothetical protein